MKIINNFMHGQDTITYDIKISKKGKVFLGKKKSNNAKVLIKDIIKKKIIYLKEGMIITTSYRFRCIY